MPESNIYFSCRAEGNLFDYKIPMKWGLQRCFAGLGDPFNAAISTVEYLWNIISFTISRTVLWNYRIARNSCRRELGCKVQMLGSVSSVNASICGSFLCPPPPQPLPQPFKGFSSSADSQTWGCLRHKLASGCLATAFTLRIRAQR